MLMKIFLGLLLFLGAECIVTDFLFAYLHFWPTIFLFFMAAIAGVAVIKNQGLKAFSHLKNSIFVLSLPKDELGDSILLLLGGILLIIPGLLTDVAALILFMPSVRNKIKNNWKRKFKRRDDDSDIIDI